MNMKRLFLILTLAAFVMLAKPAQAQLIEGPRGYEDFKIGVAGYTYRSYDIDQTLAFLKSMEVHYMSVKDWWLPLDSTKEQMDAFKAKCREYDVEPYILGPIYMRSEAEVDRAFAYAERYGSDVFIGVPNYELTDYVIKKVKDTGIKMAIHTHGPDGAPFPNIQKVAEVYKDPSLGIGCCMDLGHSVRMGEDIVKDIKKYKAWIYDIHIKDESEASKAGKTWEMGRGVMDFRPIMKVLRQIKYQGVVSLEFEKNGDNPHPGIAESIGYLRGVADATK